MIDTLRRVLQDTLERLSDQLMTYLPGFLAGVTILFVAYWIARATRWLLNRIFKGIAFDRFLRQSGISGLLNYSGRFRATRLVADTAYWGILLLGLLTGFSAFNTQITSRIIESVLLLLPRMVIAALIILAGIWLGQFLGRSTLVWAVNEGIPSPRRWAAAVRVILVFIAVVVAADQLNFAKNVFLAAFILLMGGVVLAVSLALGLGSREIVRHYFQEASPSSEESLERSLRDHL
jgi:hypothetical protein